MSANLAPRLGLLLLTMFCLPSPGLAQQQTRHTAPPDVTSQNKLNQALFRAVERGNVTALKALLARGGNVEARPKYGQTLLMRAAFNQKLDAVQLLVENGADVNAQANGESTLFFALGGDGSVVNYLLDHGADINFRTRDGYSALMSAVIQGLPLDVKTLLSRGARTDYKDQDGHTVLDLALVYGRFNARIGRTINGRVKYATRADFVKEIRLLSPDSPSFVDPDTGVTIIEAPDSGMFPDEWRAPSMSVKADALDAAEVNRCLRILQKEFKKYPPALLREHLDAIYIVKNLFRRNTLMGGFSWLEAKTLYIGDDPGCTDNFLALTFHHEFVHLLIDEEPTRFSRSAWERLNRPGFHYSNDAQEGIRTNKYSRVSPDPSCWPSGFGRFYGMADMNEDTATVAELLFSGDPNFWQTVEQYPILYKKVNMLIAFYHKLDRTFTPDYFRTLSPVPD